MNAALLRLIRVLVAQGITWAIAYYANINVPILNISAGAVISAIAKYLRDKYKWEWLPV
jgi:hypothetical protein